MTDELDLEAIKRKYNPDLCRCSHNDNCGFPTHRNYALGVLILRLVAEIHKIKMTIAYKENIPQTAEEARLFMEKSELFIENVELKERIRELESELCQCMGEHQCGIF